MTKSGHCFSKLGHLFPFFQKGQGKAPHPSLSSYAPGHDRKTTKMSWQQRGFSCFSINDWFIAQCYVSGVNEKFYSPTIKQRKSSSYSKWMDILFDLSQDFLLTFCYYCCLIYFFVIFFYFSMTLCGLQYLILYYLKNSKWCN